MRSVPWNERFSVKLTLKSQLGFDVVLKRLHLTVDENSAVLEKEVIEQVITLETSFLSTVLAPISVVSIHVMYFRFYWSQTRNGWKWSWQLCHDKN